MIKLTSRCPKCNILHEVNKKFINELIHCICGYYHVYDSSGIKIIGKWDL